MSTTGPANLISPSAPRPARYVETVALILLVAAVLAWNAANYLPFLADDSLISFRYTERLLDGQGLTWTDGQPVEGYSNLLWILLLAVPASLGVDLILASRILGMAGMMLTLAVIAWFFLRRCWAGLPAVAYALLVAALSGSFGVWAVGGMEQPLQAVLLALGLMLAFRLYDDNAERTHLALIVSIPLALLAITRPDGFLFTITIALGLLVTLGTKRETWGLIIRLALLPALFVAGQEIFRLTYYGVWLPNPAYVKITGSEKHLMIGLAYLRDGFLYNWPLTLAALLGVVALLTRRASLSAASRGRLTIELISMVTWCAYIAFVGGDIFPARRHFLPVIILMALLSIDGLGLIVDAVKQVRWRIVLMIGMGVLVTAQHYTAVADPENKRAVEERWEWDGQVVGLMLRDGFGERDPLLACTAAGCLPYWSEMRCVDMLGLNDYHIARAHPADFGEGRPAHELGDGRYVLERQPDLISFCGPRGGLAPCYRAGKEMVQLPEFRRDYTPVKLEGRHPYRYGTIMWLRRFSDAIGISLSDSLIQVPSYLINGHSGTFAYLDDDNRFVITVGPDNPGVILQLPVPSGGWTISAPEAAARQTPITCMVRVADGNRPLADGALPLSIELGDNMLLNIMLRSERPLVLHGVELRHTQ